jgi:hypothetical protein
MNAPAPIGHNNPPDPIDQIETQFADVRTEAENWTDGTTVENEGQMNAVDVLRKSMRDYRLALEKGQKSASAPLHDAWKAEVARWKPTIDDAKRIEDCLVAVVGAFKKKLEAQKEAERRAAWEAANKARQEAEEAARKAAATDLEAQRAAADAAQAAIDAQAAAQAAQRDTVKGMRTVTKYEITDHKALLNWIARNDRDAMTAFIEAWAQKNHKTTNADGLNVWQEKEAF